MQITFWGVRGSYPVPGAATVKYGGQTSCVEARTASGETVIIDAGTGMRQLGNKLARRMVAALTSKGRTVRTTSLHGFLLLYFVAGLRPIRRTTLRYAAEQESLERWLALVAAHAPSDPALALEIVACRNLVKGYGDTHERGLRKYDALRAEWRAGASAGRIAALRGAALADEAGDALRAELQRTPRAA